jgi:hypothetical protein
LAAAWQQLEGAAVEVSSLLGLTAPVSPGDLLFLRACVGERFTDMAPPDLPARRSALMVAAEQSVSAGTAVLAIDLVDTWQDEPEPSRTAYAVVLMLSAAAVVSSSSTGDLAAVMEHAPGFVSAFDTPDRSVAHRLVGSAVKLASVICPTSDPVAVVRAVTDCWVSAESAVGSFTSSTLVFDEVVELESTLAPLVNPMSRPGMLLIEEMCGEAQRSTPCLRSTVAALAAHVASNSTPRDRYAHASAICPGVPDHRELSGSSPDVEAFLEILFLNRVSAVEATFGAAFAQHVRNVWVQYVDEMLDRTVSRRTSGAASWGLLSVEFESMLRSWVSTCLRDVPPVPFR